MRTSTYAFVCAVLFSACAFGESSSGGDDDDSPPPPTDPVCGDGTCSSSEVGNCAQDCGTAGPTCGNGNCETGETNASCPADCPASGPICGDGTCDAAGGETNANCPGDCTTGGGGSLDCQDPLVLFSCVVCLQDTTQCAALGVDEAGCTACAGL
jgi:hypothetical protein